VILIWAYPLSFVFAKRFWHFLYFDLFGLKPYIVAHFIGVGFILLAIFSGIALVLHLFVCLAPNIRRVFRPRWFTHVFAFAALWIFYGTTATISGRPYPFIRLPTDHDRVKLWDFKGHA